LLGAPVGVGEDVDRWKDFLMFDPKIGALLERESNHALNAVSPSNNFDISGGVMFFNFLDKLGDWPRPKKRYGPEPFRPSTWKLSDVSEYDPDADPMTIQVIIRLLYSHDDDEYEKRAGKAGGDADKIGKEMTAVKG